VVRLDLLPHLIGREFLEEAREEVARVVDEHVDPVVVAEGRRHERAGIR
jgi:hypothetical protein